MYWITRAAILPIFSSIEKPYLIKWLIPAKQLVYQLSISDWGSFIPMAIIGFIEDYNPFITNLLRKRFMKTQPEFIERIRFFPRLMFGPDYINLLKISD